MIIDVRTPEEFDDGHLVGALNIDAASPEFDARIAELDIDDTYVVYCRTGSRAADAIERMAEVGIADTRNLGALADAAEATGVEITQP